VVVGNQTQEIMATTRRAAAAELEDELPQLNALQQKELNQLVEGLGGWDEDLYVKNPDALGA
jgi:hypothetical protein